MLQLRVYKHSACRSCTCYFSRDLTRTVHVTTLSPPVQAATVSSQVQFSNQLSQASHGSEYLVGVLLLANDVTHIEGACHELSHCQLALQMMQWTDPQQVLNTECTLPRNSLNAIELAKVRFADLTLYYPPTDTAVSYCAGTTTTKQMR